MSRRVLSFGLMLAACASLHAQVTPDTVARSPRAVPERVLEEARADGSFAYEEVAQAPGGEGVWATILRALDRLFQAATHQNARLLHYALLVVLVLWIVVMIVRMEPRGAFRRAPAQVAVGGGMPGDIRTRDYLREAQQARREGAMRLAVRYLFLHVLQRLADAGQVVYRPEKTNRAYEREVAVRLRPGFTAFVRAFEAAWYGGTTPTGEDLDALESAFVAFEQQLRGGDAG